MLLLILKMRSAARFLPHILITRFRRPVDLASRRTKTTAQLGMHVRCTIITDNLNLSIWQRLAEIE
jgi:hypothetical protein